MTYCSSSTSRSGEQSSYVNHRHSAGWNDANKGSPRALRARAGSRRGRRGRPVLRAPVLGAADRKRRNCPGVRCVLFEVPKVTMHEAVKILISLHSTTDVSANPTVTVTVTVIPNATKPPDYWG